MYCCWLAFEVVFIYLFFPETSGRTLEELSFRKLFSICSSYTETMLLTNSVFENRDKADAIAAVVHKEVEHGIEQKQDVAHIEIREGRNVV